MCDNLSDAGYFSLASVAIGVFTMYFGYVAGNHEWNWEMEERCPVRFHCPPADIAAADEASFSLALPFYVGGFLLTALPFLVMTGRSMFCPREPRRETHLHLFVDATEGGAPIDPAVLHAADREDPAGAVRRLPTANSAA